MGPGDKIGDSGRVPIKFMRTYLAFYAQFYAPSKAFYAQKWS